MTTKLAPVGVKKPVEGSLEGISDTYASKLDGTAVWTPREEQPYCDVEHDSSLHLSQCCLAQGRRDS